ncbi:MAG: leucyl aminopeptidase [Henriciella sp.]|nr:leucyl aminopeptidase [Henriciella sp.]
MTFKRGLVVGLTATMAAPLALAGPSFDFTPNTTPDDGDIAIYVGVDQALSDIGTKIDRSVDGRLSAALQGYNFDGAFGSVLTLRAMAPYQTITVIGTGDEALTARHLADLGGYAATTNDGDAISLVADGLSTDVDGAGAYLAKGYALGGYHFLKYKMFDADNPAPEPHTVTVAGTERASKNMFERDLGHLVDGVTFARDLGTEPGNTLWPQDFVERVQTAFEGTRNTTITVLDADAIRANGMGALMGVGQGSIHDPRLLVVEYRGGETGDAPIALVGKGITFDTGGISIKPNNGMWLMKSDLSGAAAVAGTVLAAAKRGENVNVVGVMPLAENMPSQDAIRPGDVLTSMSGKTIEIMSTDAEGRLLLADAVYYAQQEYELRLLVNIATLTGSAARAMGDDYAAIITRELPLSLEMMEVGKRAGEDVWPLPLHPSHFVQIESLIADIKNTGGHPGASIGAAVVGTFVAEDLPWVHLDIAGVDWRDEPTATVPVGHGGWGVRFMDELLRSESD